MLCPWLSSTKTKVGLFDNLKNGKKSNVRINPNKMGFIFCFNSWYREMDRNNPNALIELTEKTFKYKFEATIPEPEVCSDCILARITVINVIAGDYGNYVLRASSEQFVGVMAEGRVRLYGNESKTIKHQSIFVTFILSCFLILETPECQQSITNPDNKGCRSPPSIMANTIRL
jgi:hypothetical protein